MKTALVVLAAVTAGLTAAVAVVAATLHYSNSY